MDNHNLELSFHQEVIRRRRRCHVFLPAPPPLPPPPSSTNIAVVRSDEAGAVTQNEASTEYLKFRKETHFLPRFIMNNAFWAEGNTSTHK